MIINYKIRKYSFTIFLLFLLFSCEYGPNFYKLEIKVNPSEGGTVSPKSGIYLEQEIVNINAIPNEDYVFKSWSGTNDPSPNKKILINRDKSITANFVKNPANELLKFSLLKKNNPTLIDDIFFDINGSEVYAYSYDFVDGRNLIPTFVHNGKNITVDNEIQFSNVSSHNFNKTLFYKIEAANGEIMEYEINLESFTNLPVILIETELTKPIISKSEYVEGKLTFIGKNFKNANFTKSMKIRGRGNFTWSQPKKPYQLKFDKKTSLLDMPADKKWIFLANYADKTMSRNAISFELGYLSNLLWTPKNEFAEVFINGNYNGTYQITEKVEQDEHRVNIGKNGFLLEIDSAYRLKDDDVHFFTDKNLFVIKSPEIDVDSKEYNYIKEYIFNFEKILYSNNFDGYESFIDIDSFVDWYLINEINKNDDSNFFSSCYFTLIPGEKLKMGPIWDYDLSFGNINRNDNDKPEGFWIKESPGTPESNNWYKQLFKDKKFVEKVKSRFAHFYDNKGYLINFSNILSNKLSESRNRNDKIWNTLGVYIFPNNPLNNFSSFEEEHDNLNDWISRRFDWLNEEIYKL